MLLFCAGMVAGVLLMIGAVVLVAGLIQRGYF